MTGSISASFLAGTTATTSGHTSGSEVTRGSRWLVRQKPPCPATRYTQASAAAAHAMLNPSIPAASHTGGRRPKGLPNAAVSRPRDAGVK